MTHISIEHDSYESFLIQLIELSSNLQIRTSIEVLNDF